MRHENGAVIAPRLRMMHVIRKRVILVKNRLIYESIDLPLTSWSQINVSFCPKLSQILDVRFDHILKYGHQEI